MSVNSLSTAWSTSPVGRVAAPLREQVIAALTAAIMDFRLKPGQRLVERELIEHLGVSRTTIREALRELASEGLVTVVPQKGAIVSAPTPADARDLYEVRAALESLIVGRFTERATDEQIDQLDLAVEAFAEAVAREDEIRSALNLKDVCYEVLLTGAESPVFRQLIEGIQARVRLLRAASLSEEGRSKAAVQELRGIVMAIRARDTEQATALTRAHVEAAAATALGNLASDQEAAPA